MRKSMAIQALFVPLRAPGVFVVGLFKQSLCHRSRGARIINLGLGATTDSAIMREAIAYVHDRYAEAQSDRGAQRKSQRVSEAVSLCFLCSFSASLHLCVKTGGFTNSFLQNPL